MTGGGKTLLALALAERLQNQQVSDLRAAVVVPTIVLMHQWYDELLAHGDLPAAAIGRLGGGYKDDFSAGRRILIAVLASAHKLLPRLRPQGQDWNTAPPHRGRVSSFRSEGDVAGIPDRPNPAMGRKTMPVSPRIFLVAASVGGNKNSNLKPHRLTARDVRARRGIPAALAEATSLTDQRRALLLFRSSQTREAKLYSQPRSAHIVGLSKSLTCG